MSSHLCPFALWTAFPSSPVGRYSHDYYGHSVAMGFAPRRRSRVRPCHTSEHDVGVPLIPLITLAGQRSTLRRLRRPLYDAAAEHGAGFGCLSGGLALGSAGDWDIRQSSFRHIARAPRCTVPYVWTRPPVSWHAPVPFTFRIQVSHSAPEPPFEFRPATPGIQQGASRRIRSTP